MNNTEKEKINEISDGELELISGFARKKLGKDEIYTFSLVLCDNEIDRDGEKFTVQSLRALAKLFVGKTGIFDHNMKSKDQSARIYSAEVLTDETKKTADGEPYTFVKARAYMARTQKNEDLIKEIDAGIKKETSVGCCVREINCSICGKNIKNGGCGHQKGKIYDGKLCCHLLSDPTDAYEWSFVAVPAQKNAGVIKSFSFSQKGEDLAKWAEAYKNELKSEIIRLSAAAIPELKSETVNALCEALGPDSLTETRNALRRNLGKKAPLFRQLKSAGTDCESKNSKYKF